jgi:hypothetical protein
MMILALISINYTSAEPAAPNKLEIEIHLLINAERERADPTLPVLRFQSTLIEIARAHSKDMYDNIYFNHVNLEGQDPFDRIQAQGVTYSSAGENLFRADGYPENEIAEIAVQGWINSKGHYENMISYFSFTGIGVHQIGLNYHITQIFVQSSETEMRSNGVIFENGHFDDINYDEPSFYEKYQQELIVGGLILFVILIGKRAESLNRRGYRR